MRLINADALLEAIYKIYGAKHAPQGIINLITNALTIQRGEQDNLAGWVSVPIEPTEEMIEAITSHLLDDNWHPDSVHEIDMPSLYKAMIQDARDKAVKAAKK